MSSAYWDIVPAAVGGIIGALAGGVPAWLIARKQLLEALKRDEDVRVRNEKSSAFQVAIKLILITNNIVGLRTHVQKCLRMKLIATNAHMEDWQVLLPMVGFTDEHNVRFSGEETSIFSQPEKPISSWI